MPNFGIGPVPIRISQVGTQEALIRNTGNSTLYLDQYSSVSEGNHGLSLQPFSSVNWAAGRELWAVTAPNDETTVTVLYGATGTALSEVSAVVTGDVTATVDGPVNANITNASIPVTGTVNANVTNAVIPVNGTVNANIQNASIPVTGNVNVTSGTVNATIQNASIPITGNVGITSGTVNAVVNNATIASGTVNVGGILTPVTIEGGGGLVLNQTTTMTAGQVLNINVPLPGSGRTFYAFKIKLQINDAQHATIPRILSYTDTFDNFTTIVRNPSSTQSLGIPWVHSFTIPAQASTFSIQLRNTSGALTTNFTLRIDGVNVGAPTPTSNLGYILNSATPLTFVLPSVAPDLEFWAPASFQPYNLLYRAIANSPNTVGMGLGYADSAGAFPDFVGRAYNILPTQSGDFNGFVTAYIPVSGNGRAAHVNFPANGSQAGTWGLSIVS